MLLSNVQNARAKDSILFKQFNHFAPFADTMLMSI